MFSLVALLTLAAEPAPISRLDLARTWEAAQLFHPSMMHRESVVDEGFVAAVKALDAAKTAEERRAAAALILAPLKDPSTRVFVPPEVTPGAFFDDADGGVLTIHAARMPNTEWADPLMETATRFVVDLRGATLDNPMMGVSVFPSRRVVLPAVQSMAHAGFDSNRPSIFTSRMEQTPGAVFRADAESVKRRFAIVLNAEDPIPDWAIAQREAGLAVFVSGAELSDDSALSSTDVPLGDGAIARVRTGEYIGGGGLVATDVRVPKGKDPLVVAREALRGNARPKKLTRTAKVIEPLREFKLGEVDEKLPDREHRLLGALRLWMVARRFWAYPSLRRIDADEELLELLSLVEAADTPQAYRDVISEGAMLLMPDSHVRVWSKELASALTWPPFNVKLIDDLPVVTDVTDKAGNVRKWDIIERIDGEKLTLRVAERLRTSPGSRLDGRQMVALEAALNRKPGAHQVMVFHASGGSEMAQVTWDEEEAAKLMAPRGSAPHFKVLADNIGFIDLVNLTADEVDAAMNAVKDTRALIFDVRGYPHGTAFDIGPRLGFNKDISGVAQICVPIVRSAASGLERVCEASLQRLPAWEGERYTNPVIALIDNEAISHAEHSCLILEAYTNVTFIGSPTRGANGNVSHVALPGGLSVSFTGLEVRHADGRQLQTTGIVPQILVRPTIAGLRAGRDQVLERALTFVRTGK